MQVDPQRSRATDGLLPSPKVGRGSKMPAKPASEGKGHYLQEGVVTT